ncbi:MAG: CPBP family intramembrane metalloprotease [Prolixibacteraceae bacterium]|nr:CPBP family intramembrane metalloprotease [Prolixibacteraceae bacterium]
MNNLPLFARDLKKGLFWTVLLTIVYLWKSQTMANATDFMFALPFFIVSYVILFSIGRDGTVSYLQELTGKSKLRALILPAAALLYYAFYLLINGKNPLEGNPMLIVFIMLFPAALLVFKRDAPIGWIDFTVFTLILLSGVLLKTKQNSEIPISGNSFDSLFRILVMLSAVYSFSIIRNIREVGFYPEMKWKSLGTALWVWTAFFAFAFLIGYSVGFFRWAGYEKSGIQYIQTLVFTLAGTFLHTALFEELFFRGILQNMLARRIGQAKSWKIFWIVGFVVLLIGALIVGYTLEGKMKWFPAAITVMMFGAAWTLEKSGKFGWGVYTSLAITGVIFGLVHYHAQSIIYIGFACLAGWAYGYTYIKTKNVFYSALVHTLVNASSLIFGLEMLR